MTLTLRHRRHASHQSPPGEAAPPARAAHMHRPRPSEPLVRQRPYDCVQIVAPEPVKIVKVDEWRQERFTPPAIANPHSASFIDGHGDGKDWAPSALSAMEAYSEFLEIISYSSSPDLKAALIPPRSGSVSPLSTPPAYDSDSDMQLGPDRHSTAAIVQPSVSPIPRTHNPLPLDWCFPAAAAYTAVPAALDYAPFVNEQQRPEVPTVPARGHKRKSASLSFTQVLVPRLALLLAQQAY